MDTLERINVYHDGRFSPLALRQHGCFLVNGTDPYEVEIVSKNSALIRGKDRSIYPDIISEFMFYAPHITQYFDAEGKAVARFPDAVLLPVPLDKIQPSQFYADEEKVNALKDFITTEENIVIQVLRDGERYISLDGHTRLYIAVRKNFDKIYAVESESGEYIAYFVAEAKRRGVYSPWDLTLLPHGEYVEKWHKFCDEYFKGKEA